MPVLQIYSESPAMPDGLADELGQLVSELLEVRFEKVWVMWIPIAPGNLHRPPFPTKAFPNSPIVVMHCKISYPPSKITAVLTKLKSQLAFRLRCSEDSVFAIAHRVHGGDLLAFGEVWSADSPHEIEQDVCIRPIGWICSPVKTATDDCWGGVISTIVLDQARFTEESIRCLGEFSHVEVIFLLHDVNLDHIVTQSRHPRGRTDWPQVGIFAQRAKDRPNRIGLSVCSIVKIEGTRIDVSELDAIDGTPVLDIKPYLPQFGPRGDVRQPKWSIELMENYFSRVR